MTKQYVVFIVQLVLSPPSLALYLSCLLVLSNPFLYSNHLNFPLKPVNLHFKTFITLSTSQNITVNIFLLMCLDYTYKLEDTILLNVYAA